MVHFGLRENSYEKRRCFFWLLVRVNSVNLIIFLEILSNFPWNLRSTQLVEMEILEGFRENFEVQ